ncbi:hypothetical protein BH11ARM1_BH11ARM1_05670 [soil metagenome]
MANAYLIPGLEATPRAIQLIVEAVDPSHFDVRTDPERFSLREAVAHIADWEAIIRERMTAALEAPGSTVKAYDEGQLAIDREYALRNPVEEANRFLAERTKTVALVKGFSEENWGRVVVHSVRGEMTLYDQANLVLGHDLYHIEHLTQYLRLG